MSNEINAVKLTAFAATIAAVADIAPPAQAQETTHWLVSLLKTMIGGTPARTVIYNPDAIAMWLYQEYPGDFAGVLRFAPVAVPTRSVLPSVTPVCFASMYTGTPPAVHGIEKYEKPVVMTDTLFDAYVRAGKKVAIVAVKGSSMAKIFAERAVDYYILPYDTEVSAKAAQLIREDVYDLISVYTQAYDDMMHLTGVRSEPALEAMRSQTAIFEALGTAAAQTGKNTLLCFAPDHGVHNNEHGLGKHGDDSPEDLNILHFFGVV